MEKFWFEVSDRLEKRDKALYFVGGTLSVALDETRAVALNLDGSGFVMNSKRYTWMKNDKVYPPLFITHKVRNIYLETKGITEHYQESVLVGS